MNINLEIDTEDAYFEIKTDHVAHFLLDIHEKHEKRRTQIWLSRKDFAKLKHLIDVFALSQNINDGMD